VQRFERMLEEYVGARHVRCVSSCSAALLLVLKASGIGPGDEVLVPTMTFVATANAVELAGATPVLVDCEPGTGLIDLELAEAAITERTRALIVVHLAGAPLDMDRVNALRDRHSVLVLEDAAHALGARWAQRPVGAHGNPTAFSFYATKNITTAEGGAIATGDDALVERIERLSLHGLSSGAWSRFSDEGFKHYEVEEPGYKANMTDLHAALGIHQLPRLDEWVDGRAEVWGRYDDLLDGLPLRLPSAAAPPARHARHLYRVELEPGAPLARDQLLHALDERGVGTGVHYRAVHLQPYYRRTYGLQAAQFPVASAMSERTLSLPLGASLSAERQDRVVRALRSVL
jgi:dTDP-4-amino-4,6-dideoxygalactose transaminase